MWTIPIHLDETAQIFLSLVIELFLVLETNISHFNDIDIIHAESYWQNIMIFTSLHCGQLFMVKVAITGEIYLATL